MQRRLLLQVPNLRARTAAALVVVLAICAACAERARASSPADQPISIAQFQAQLDTVDLKIEELRLERTALPDFLRTLPDAWLIRDGGMEFSVPTSWLRSGLLEMPLEDDKAIVAAQKLHHRVQLLRGETKSYQGRRTAESERRRLAAILARREFGGVSGPTLWDRIAARIQRWLLDILGRIFGSEAVPAIGKTVAWLAIVAAVALLCLWAWRFFSRNAGVPSIATDVVSIGAKPWNEWLKEAQAAAQHSNWRDGVRLAYWAGISNLESRGLWLPDRARTPREYLRLMGESSEFKMPLQAITAVFEGTWYGRRAATADAFSQMLAELQRMECQ